METTWLDSLQRELGDVDPESIKGPSEEQSSHEQFVGYAPESLRKLYALSRRHARTAAEIMVQAGFRYKIIALPNGNKLELKKLVK